MLDNLTNFIIPAVEHFRGAGYWLAFFAALLETVIPVGLFIPGSTLILFLGALSGRGYLDTGDLIWFAAMGAILGDNIDYYLGRRYGAKWLQSGIWFIKSQHLEKGRHFFDAHGAKSVFLGRFVPSIKEIIPFIAGSLKMKRKTFFTWNVLGAIGWGCEWVLAGYIFAQSLTVAKLWLARAGVFFALLFVVTAILYLFKWVLIKRGKRFFDFIGSLWGSISQAILANHEVAQWLQRHPRIISFLKKRLDTSAFSGLPLTLATVSLIYVLALFGGIVEDLIASDPIIAADIRIANLLAAFRTDPLTNVFLWITLLGKWQVVAVFMVTAVALLWVWRKRLYIIPLIVTVFGSEIFTYLGKLAFHRPRPEMAAYAEHSFSFPSGHATMAVAFYGFIAYVAIRAAPTWKRKVNILFAGLVVVLAIGLSRLYLGVHYLSDVWSGYLVGAMWLIIGTSFAEWLHYGKEKSAPFSRHLPARLFSIGLICGALLFYAGFARHYNPTPASVSSPQRFIPAQSIEDVFANNQLKFTGTVIGEKQEPLSFVVVAKDSRRLVDLFQRAGWYMADKADSSSLIKAVKAVFLKTGYPSAPISPSFWNSKIQDFGFEKPTEANKLGQAHHAKFWATDYTLASGKHIYVGTANAIAGVKWVIVPKIAADIDTEREVLFQDLKRTGSITSYQKKQFVEPQVGRNFSGDVFFTDGKAYIVFID